MGHAKPRLRPTISAASVTLSSYIGALSLVCSGGTNSSFTLLASVPNPSPWIRNLGEIDE